MGLHTDLSREEPALPPTAFAHAKHGGAALEFALVAPILLALLLGIFVYGGYFLVAHSTQQLANDAARAAIAGLDDAERLDLAERSVADALTQQPFLQGEVTNVRLDREGALMSLRITYDAQGDLFWALSSLIPAPSPTILRTASVRLGDV